MHGSQPSSPRHSAIARAAADRLRDAGWSATVYVVEGEVRISVSRPVFVMRNGHRQMQGCGWLAVDDGDQLIASLDRTIDADQIMATARGESSHPPPAPRRAKSTW